MTRKKIVFAAPLALALALGACGGGSSKSAEAAYCPQPFTVQDAGRITRFKDGAGHDPRDIAFEAQLVGAGATCTLRRDRLDVTLIMRVAVNAGPSITGAVTRVPYFVRVLDSSGSIVQGQDFTADFKLSSASPRGQSQEELSLTLPVSGGYRIAVGLKPTPAELNYNRRADTRQ